MRVNAPLKIAILLILSIFLINCGGPKKRVVQVDLIEVLEQKSNTSDPQKPVKLEYSKSVTWAYLEVIETSPNVKGVSRVTSNESEEACLGFVDYSPVADEIVYSLTEKATLAPDEKTGSGKDSNQYITNIWRQTIGSFAKTRLTVGNRVDITPTFTADGTKVVFSSIRSGTNRKLWIINVDGGGGLRLLTGSTSEDYSPYVSRKDDIVAFTSLPANSIIPQIWTTDLEGRLATQLKEGKNPRISPDGKWLVYLKHKPGLECNSDDPSVNGQLYQVWKMTIDGSRETQLTTNQEYCVRDPMWSPDGKWIVYSSDENLDIKKRKNFDIWLMAADGTQRLQLTTNGSMDIKPLFDRTGEHILFLSNRGGLWNIWRFKPVLY